MKNITILLMLVLATVLAVPLGYAIEETQGTAMPTKTLADFNREYPGKAIVAWYRYEEYKKALEQAPKPTLEPSRMRTEGVSGSEKTLADFQMENPGKAIVGWYHYEQHKKHRA